MAQDYKLSCSRLFLKLEAPLTQPHAVSQTSVSVKYHFTILMRREVQAAQDTAVGRSTREER